MICVTLSSSEPLAVVVVVFGVIIFTLARQLLGCIAICERVSCVSSLRDQTLASFREQMETVLEREALTGASTRRMAERERERKAETETGRGITRK